MIELIFKISLYMFVIGGAVLYGEHIYFRLTDLIKDVRQHNPKRWIENDIYSLTIAVLVCGAIFFGLLALVLKGLSML